MVRVFYVFMLSILFFNMLLNLVMPLCLVFIFQHFIMYLCLIVSSFSMQVIGQYEQRQVELGDCACTDEGDEEQCRHSDCEEYEEYSP